MLSTRKSHMGCEMASRRGGQAAKHFAKSIPSHPIVTRADSASYAVRITPYSAHMCLPSFIRGCDADADDDTSDIPRSCRGQERVSEREREKNAFVFLFLSFYTSLGGLRSLRSIISHSPLQFWRATYSALSYLLFLFSFSLSLHTSLLLLQQTPCLEF